MTASPTTHPRWLKPVAIATIVVFVVALLGYAYASPYIALNRIKRAANARDAAALNQYVDYPALRASLKEQVGEMLQKRLQKQLDTQNSDNPLLLFGAAIGTALIGPMVDAYMTPDGVAALLNGLPPRGEPGERPPTAGTNEPRQEAAPAASVQPPVTPVSPPVASEAGIEVHPQTTAGYRGINAFVVTWRHSADEPVYAAILRRHGLFTWKLAAVELND